MTLIDNEDGLVISGLSLEDLEFVSGGDVPQPACQCHTDRNNNLVCQDANGRKCGE